MWSWLRFDVDVGREGRPDGAGRLADAELDGSFVRRPTDDGNVGAGDEAEFGQVAESGRVFVADAHDACARAECELGEGGVVALVDVAFARWDRRAVRVDTGLAHGVGHA